MKTLLTLSLSLTFLIFSHAQDITTNLLAKYNFDEGSISNDQLADLSENDNSMDLFNVYIFDFDRFDNFDGATMFGTGSHASLNEDQNNGTFASLDQFSFSFYNLMVPAGLDDGDLILASLDADDDYSLQFLYRKENGQDFYILKFVDDDVVLFERIVSYDYSTGQNFNWAHIGFSFDAINDQAQFYVDGTLRHTIDMTLPTLENVSFHLGRSAEETFTCFDDMFIYDRILAPEDMELLFETHIEATPTSVLDQDNNQDIAVFPIPSKDHQISISVNGYSDVINVQVHDQIGRLVESAKINSSERIDLSHLSAGLYYLNLEVGDEVFTKKIQLVGGN